VARRFLVGFLLLAVVIAGAAVWLRWQRQSAAVAEGRTVFRERCSVCHGKDGEGAQGPSLTVAAGGKAASDAQFDYSHALRASALRWDAPTLERYLAAPTEIVPGTTMTIPTESPSDRQALVAFLFTLPKTRSTLPPIKEKAEPAPAGSAGLRTGRVAFGGFQSDAPGVRRRITLADLPLPFATDSARNNAKVVDAPEGAAPKVPPGFRVAPFAKGLKSPRLLRVAPNGDLFVAASDAGEIQVLRTREGAATAERVETFAKGLDDPFGIAFFPAGPSPEWVYVAEANSVRRYPYANGDLTARGAPETIVPRISPTSGGHTMRDLAFSHDDRRFFLAVGSASNVAEGLPARSSDEIRAFEAAHGRGATWGAEESRANVLVFDPDGKDGRPYATGLRNCSGLTVNPETDEVWCAVNERDKLGEDLVPDYVTRVRENGFYGWPWYYLGDHEDPRHKGARRDLAGKVTVPDVLLQPHSAALQITFYEATMFPPEYQGSAFVALHGSWNRQSRTGYKVIRIIMKGGAPSGEYEDFMTGFVIDDERVWARPVGVTVANDGALLVGEDGNGTIWRVTYQ
jgi:glucose/arabinose dehydrogenase/cytochrome c2